MPVLSDRRHELFAQAVAKGMPATRAYMECGYKAKSDAVAQAGASRLLSRVMVAERIKEWQQVIGQASGEKVVIDAAWLLGRLSDEVHADINDLRKSDGTWKPVHEWPLIWRQGLVQGIETDGKGNIVKIKVSDRVKRLELVGRHVKVGAFNDKMTLEAGSTLEQLILAAAALRNGGKKEG